MSDVIIPSEVKQTIETRVAWAHQLVIRTPEDREQAIAIVKEVKGFTKAVEASFDATVKAAHATWKAAVAHRDSFLRGPAEVEALAKGAIVRYDAEVKAAQEKERIRLQAIADETARREKERLEKEAARLKTPELKEARLEQAAAIVPQTVAMPEAPKQEGESKAVIWKARVIDQQAFIKAAVEAGRFEFVEVNESALNIFARTTRGQVKLTGVEFYSETQMRVRI